MDEVDKLKLKEASKLFGRITEEFNRGNFHHCNDSYDDETFGFVEGPAANECRHIMNKGLKLINEILGEDQ